MPDAASAMVATSTARFALLRAEEVCVAASASSCASSRARLRRTLPIRIRPSRVAVGESAAEGLSTAIAISGEP